jgi:hypothetical protein
MQLWRGTHGLRFLFAVFVAGFLALVLTVGFAKGSPSAPTTVKISQNAQFISSFQINVVVTLSCSAGAGYSVEVDVQQPQGFGSTTSGSGFTSGQCTGRAQKLAVPVFAFFNSWQLGNAVASATACTAACGSDTKQINIVP